MASQGNDLNFPFLIEEKDPPKNIVQALDRIRIALGGGSGDTCRTIPQAIHGISIAILRDEVPEANDILTSLAILEKVIIETPRGGTLPPVIK